MGVSSRRAARDDWVAWGYRSHVSARIPSVCGVDDPHAVAPYGGAVAGSREPGASAERIGCLATDD